MEKLILRLSKKFGEKGKLLKITESSLIYELPEVSEEISEHFGEEMHFLLQVDRNEAGYLLSLVFPGQALRFPHVESDGTICLGSHNFFTDAQLDAGINWILEKLKREAIPFFRDIRRHENEFRREARSYWEILVKRQTHKLGRVFLCFNPSNASSDLYVYHIPNRNIFLAASNQSEAGKFLSSFAAEPKRYFRGFLLNIGEPLCPKDWPATFEELSDFCYARVFSYHRKTLKKLFAKPGFVILKTDNCGCFSYWFNPRNNQAIKLTSERLDFNWLVGRDSCKTLQKRIDTEVVMIGCGAAGSSVSAILLKSGICKFCFIDFDKFSAGNVGRHYLGLEALRKNKALEMEETFTKESPYFVSCGAFDNTVNSFRLKAKLEELSNPVIIDFTAEPSAWRIEERINQTLSSRRPIIIGWYEPYVSAAHLLICPSNYRINLDINLVSETSVFDFGQNGVMSTEQGTCTTFQSYSYAAAMEANAIFSEAIIEAIDNELKKPLFLSFVKTEKYLSRQGGSFTTKKPDLLPNGSHCFSHCVERDFENVLIPI